MPNVKKKTESETLEKSMSDLVLLHCRCTAIFQENLFGWTADRQIDKIGKLAKQAIEYKIGEELTANRKRREEIEAEYRKPYEDVPYDEANDEVYRENLRKDKEYTDLFKRERELWETTIPDFQFQPVKVKVTNDVIKKIKKPERLILFRGGQYNTEVYTALGDLIDEGYLVETT